MNEMTKNNPSENPQSTKNSAREKLNLARKWRPQDFDQIVGQSISTRILKNSLFLKKYFPVYLFAGQRGCGKTTTARVFATAINCQSLPLFQEKPTEQSIPCLSCSSCTAMIAGNHPDFIEIDAASHTGVDNVRQIIEASNYIPLSGQKKIYLIDEAHMLSKAAFNAFLKILEEPSETVLFILATTELQKIPQTVLSRCFQLTFSSIEHDQLKTHLLEMCAHEKIAVNEDALDLIIQETDGSARDAINLLEQVRFSTDRITHETVLKVLGKVNNAHLIDIFELILKENPTELLGYLQSISFEKLSPQMLWDSLVELCRALLWVKYDVKTLPNSFNKDFDALSEMAQQCSLKRLHAIMQLFWQQEALFLQTNKKQTFLEMILVQLCQQGSSNDVEPPRNKAPQVRQSYQDAPQPAPKQEFAPKKIEPVAPHAPAPLEPPKKQVTNTTVEQSDSWRAFTEKVVTSCNDLFLSSIVGQAEFLGFKKETGEITLQLSNNSKFFMDKLEESKKILAPILISFFPQFTQFSFSDSPSAKTVATKMTPTLESSPRLEAHSDTATPRPRTEPAKQAPSGYNKGFAPRQRSTEAVLNKQQLENVDISNKEQWPLANLIISHFPGKIKKVNNFN